MLGCADVFGPQISLRAKNGLLLFCGQLCRHRVVVIDFFERNKAANTRGFTLGVALVIVEVTVVGWTHYDFVLLLCSGNASALPPPRHHNCIRSQTAFQNLVPSDSSSSLGAQ